MHYNQYHEMCHALYEWEGMSKNDPSSIFIILKT